MNIIVSGRKIQVTQALRQYAEDKIGKFSKYLPADAEVVVTLSVQKHLQKADVSIKAKNMHIKAESVTEEMYSAIDEITLKLDRQIKKLKGKLTDHRPKGAEGRGRSIRLEAPAESGDGLIIERKRYATKPMAPDEAAMQLSVSDANFFVFINSESGATNVIYRRTDGNFGLIETVSK